MEHEHHQNLHKETIYNSNIYECSGRRANSRQLCTHDDKLRNHFLVSCSCKALMHCPMHNAKSQPKEKHLRYSNADECSMARIGNPHCTYLGHIKVQKKQTLPASSSGFVQSEQISNNRLLFIQVQLSTKQWSTLAMIMMLMGVTCAGVASRQNALQRSLTIFDLRQPEAQPRLQLTEIKNVIFVNTTRTRTAYPSQLISLTCIYLCWHKKPTGPNVAVTRTLFTQNGRFPPRTPNIFRLFLHYQQVTK